MTVQTFAILILGFTCLACLTQCARALSTRRLARALAESLPDEWSAAYEPSVTGGRSSSDAVRLLINQGSLARLRGHDVNRCVQVLRFSDLLLGRALLPLWCALLLFAWLAALSRGAV